MDAVKGTGYGRDVLKLTLAIPFAGGAALLAAIALLQALQQWGASQANAISAAFLLMPVIWAVLAADIMMQRRLMRQVAALAVPVLVGGLFVVANS